MQKTVLNEVFALLQQIGAVSSESEFSKDWLCRSECYMRTLRFKRVKPSVGTLANVPTLGLTRLKRSVRM